MYNDTTASSARDRSRWAHSPDAVRRGRERRALAFGSTSGGLWLLEDGGDSWTMPDARLTPIACVRFAQA
jgi:hypothetical protein